MPSMTLLPGFGLPLDYVPEKQSPEERLFPSGVSPQMLDDHPARFPAFTHRELAMVKFMDKITDKENWEEKVFDDTIVHKWQAEVVHHTKSDEDIDTGQGSSSEDDECVEDVRGGGLESVKEINTVLAVEETWDEAYDEYEYESESDSLLHERVTTFTMNMFDYCIGELKYKAELSKKTGFVQVYSGDVIKSDTAIPDDLRALLNAAVAPLENVPGCNQDWHPDSDDKVLDLVNPSLYPLVYGLSRILPDTTTNLSDCITRCGNGEVLPFPPGLFSAIEGDQGCNAYSNEFQWLPCEVDISGETPKILSYINNLHPQEHTDLYQILEEVIGRVIPLWNATLSTLRKDEVFQRIAYSNVVYDHTAFEKYVKWEAPRKNAKESESDYKDRVEEWKLDNKWRFYVQPDAGTFSPPREEVQSVDLKRDYADRGLQIIVKLTNIYLTPEKSKYPGGKWHLEGQLNEHICASAIYYYDCNNILSSCLAFRQAVDPTHLLFNVPYEQNDDDWLEIFYGPQEWKPSVQDIGRVKTSQGRLITFPNFLHHRVPPFRLADPTKPGHRKILALFLVDPNMKIISTANVPCQRRDWFLQFKRKFSQHVRVRNHRSSPMIVRDVDPISLDEAKELREALMEEREEYVIGYLDQELVSQSVSLCAPIY